MAEIIEFVLGVPSIKGTVIEKRIELFFTEEGQIYKPRKGGVLKQLQLFSSKQMEAGFSDCRESLDIFGYLGPKTGVETLPLFESTYP